MVLSNKQPDGYYCLIPQGVKLDQTQCEAGGEPMFCQHSPPKIPSNSFSFCFLCCLPTTFPQLPSTEACAHSTPVPGWRGSSGLANNQLSFLCWSQKLGWV